MSDTMYCLNLHDYSTPSFVSFGKPYYGTLDELRSFINALEKDDRVRDSHKDIIAAFREFEAGNEDVTHTVAFQKIPLLEPVTMLASYTHKMEGYKWEHLNTWQWPYNMRCTEVTATHFWLKCDSYYTRCVCAKFKDLAYEGVRDEWMPVGSMIWGFPHIIAAKDKSIFNRLAVEEKRFAKKKDALADVEAFQTARDVNFTEFCNDIFGDG